MQKDVSLFPKIVNVTDIRYRWKEVSQALKEDFPVLVVEHSTPKAVIFSFKEAERLLEASAKKKNQQDPLAGWRKKNLSQFSGWQATKAIRKMRDSRWNLS